MDVYDLPSLWCGVCEAPHEACEDTADYRYACWECGKFIEYEDEPDGWEGGRPTDDSATVHPWCSPKSE